MKYNFSEERLLSEDARKLALQYGIPLELRFEMPGFHVWDGSIVKDPKEGYSLFFSRWPKNEGHDGWIDYSEVCRAWGPTPWGPFEFQQVILSRDGSDAWDAHNFHNPTIKRFGERFYIYYTGNHGNGEWWDHRNNQRIGVAYADTISGPWKRLNKPLIDINPGSWDSLCVANPSVTEKKEGGFLMIYKGVTDGPRPFGSRVLHGMAFSNDPAGPFEKNKSFFFDIPGEKFPFEDPFLWSDEKGYRCLMKDMSGVVAPLPCSIVEFYSKDGQNWDPAIHRVVTVPFLIHQDGSLEHVERLERPHYFFDRQQPCFCFAVKPQAEKESYLVFKIDKGTK